MNFKIINQKNNFNKFKDEENIALDVEGWTSYKTNDSKYKNVGVFQFDIEYCYDLVYNNNNKNIDEILKIKENKY